MARVWTRYLGLVEKYPLLTTTSSTGVLMAAGDIISQLVVEKKSLQNYDAIRSGRFLVFGFCVAGPMARYWFRFINNVYAGQKYAGFKMMATDQIFCAPVNVSLFVTGMAALRMESLDDIQKKWHRDFFPVYINAWKVWPIVQFINFTFTPLKHRVLFVNCVALFWNVYRAWVSEQPDPDSDVTVTETVIADVPVSKDVIVDVGKEKLS